MSLLQIPPVQNAFHVVCDKRLINSWARGNSGGESGWSSIGDVLSEEFRCDLRSVQ